MSKRNPDWDKLEKKMSEKRRGEKKCVTPKSGHNFKIAAILDKEELTVQRLSSELTGKNPKYSPIGAREFVPFCYPTFTLENIKKACIDHYQNMDQCVVHASCDVLATDRGPSCSSVEQLPNVNLMCVRFLEKPVDTLTLMEKVSFVQPPAKLQKRKGSFHMSKSVASKSFSSSVSTSFPLFRQAPSKRPKQSMVPSISVSSMLGLGCVIEKHPTSIKVISFDFNHMIWSPTWKDINFNLAIKPFGTGAFRNAYKANSLDTRFAGKSWVVKRFKESAIDTINTLNQTPEQQSKKVVQMHSLAQHLAKKLAAEVAESSTFGPVFTYNDIYLGKITSESSEEFVTIEQFIGGEFIKYLNNSAECDVDADEMTQKAETLAHFSFHKTDKRLLLTDIQGCKYMLCDPEIASADIYNGDEFMFCVGNLSRHAIKNFGLTHVCNPFCKELQLQEFSLEEFENYSVELT